MNILPLNVTRQDIKDDVQILVEIMKYRNKNILINKKIPESVNYYNSDNDIIVNRMRTYWDPEAKRAKVDHSKANHKLVHGYHTEIIDQATNYILGKRPEILKDEQMGDQAKDRLNNVLFVKNELHEKLQAFLTEAQLKWSAWIYVYRNDEGEFCFDLIPTEQIIAISDESLRQNIITVVRSYYKEAWDDETKKFIKWEYVEVYDDAIKDTYRRKNSKQMWTNIHTMYVLGNTMMFGENLVKEEEPELEGDSWGQVPFIYMKINEEGKTQLESYKPFIDMLDINMSDLANNMDDIQDVVWVLKNYQGEDIIEFMEDLKERKAVVVGEQGDAQPISTEIPADSREKLTERLIKAIYTFGKGVDLNVVGLSSIATETLQIMFARIDLKSNKYETQLKTAVRDLLTLMNKFVDVTPGTEIPKIEISDNLIKFNRNMIINETAIIDNLIKSKGLVSTETLLAKHPYVEDVDKELSAVEKETETLMNLEAEMNREENAARVSTSQREE